MTFLGYVDNIKKMDFVMFGDQTNTEQGSEQINDRTNNDAFNKKSVDREVTQL